MLIICKLVFFYYSFIHIRYCVIGMEIINFYVFLYLFLLILHNNTLYKCFLLFFYPLVDKLIGGGKHQNMPILCRILNIFNYFFVFWVVEHSLFCLIDGGVYLCFSFIILLLFYPYKILCYW